MNAAIYARYSSDLQRATSIEDQVRLCRRAATERGYTVQDDHVFTDSEMSGATSQRPGYQRLLTLAAGRAFSAVFVEAQDRLWRDAAEMYAALKRFLYWGVRIVSISTGSDLTDRTGKVLAAVIGLKDELFLEDLRDKTHRGMAGQVLRGFAAGGRAYGYRSEPARDEAGRIIGYRRVVDPAEAEVVRYIYQLYADGLTPRAIARRLNEERVPPPRGPRGRRAASWTPATLLGPADRLLGILRNPAYAGRVAWNRSQKVRDPETGRRIMRRRPPGEWIWVDAPDLRIGPADLWERVQARLRQRAWTPGRREGPRPRYLLSGLLVCGECGGRYTVQKRRGGVRYYACTVHFDRGATVCPNGRLVRQDRVEEAILAYVFGDLFAPPRLRYLERAVDAALERLRRHGPDLAAGRERALADARRELDNIAAAIKAGIITPTTKTMLEDAERRVAALEQAYAGRPPLRAAGRVDPGGRRALPLRPARPAGYERGRGAPPARPGA